MTTTNRKPTRQEFFAAQATMKRNGWNHILSVMDDFKDGTNYGLLYTKNGREFWMNHETMGNLPKD